MRSDVPADADQPGAERPSALRPGAHPGALDTVFRAEWGAVVASLVGFCGDVHLAEDAAGDAFATAARTWIADAPPDNPRAWLVTTGRRRIVDRIRRDRTLRTKLPLLAAEPPRSPEIPTSTAIPSSAGIPVPTAVPDERLELVFMCCHPALAPDARVALTLRSLGGLSTAEIARAFLVGEETMKRRLTRARTTIAEAGIPFAVPAERDLPARVGAVLTVVYLIFNQGYGDGRVDLAREAIDLARILHTLLPDQPRVPALLALMLLHDARRASRWTDDGLVPLAEQDRTRWDHHQIAEAYRLLDRALGGGAADPYAIQATIAALQTEDPVNWSAVAGLYATLLEQTGSPVVALNRAVAVAEVDGPAAALDLVDGLVDPAGRGGLADYRYFHTTRAELLRRLDRRDEARVAYRRGLELTTTVAEERYLRRRLAELG